MLSVEKIGDLLLYSGIFFTVLFILKTFIPADFGSEVGGDFNSVVDTDASFHLFSIEGIFAFAMCASWMGFLAQYLHYSLKITAVIAIISGIIGMLFYALLIAQFKKLQHIPQADINELVGKVGKAYMHFNPNSTSKIQIEFNSKLEILDAKNATDEEIKAFEEIKVIKIENDEVYIEKA